MTRFHENRLPSVSETPAAMGVTSPGAPVTDRFLQPDPVVQRSRGVTPSRDLAPSVTQEADPEPSLGCPHIARPNFQHNDRNNLESLIQDDWLEMVDMAHRDISKSAKAIYKFALKSIVANTIPNRCMPDEAQLDELVSMCSEVQLCLVVIKQAARRDALSPVARSIDAAMPLLRP